MDVWLLGAAAIVLIGITLWIVMWPANATETAEGETTTSPAPAADLAPAPTTVQTASEPQGVSDFQAATEPWSAPTIAHEGPETYEPEQRRPRPRRIRSAAAVVFVVCAAVGGAVIYNRWRSERDKPVGRLKRRLIR